MGSSEKNQHGAHLFILERTGTWEGVMTWFFTWYLGMEKETQGGFSGRQVIQPHPSSKKHCRAWSCWELVVLFGPEQRKSSTSFFYSLQHCLGAWFQSCKEENGSKRGQWLGDAVSKSKSRSFQPLASNELRPTKIYTISMSYLNILVSLVCSERGKPFIPSPFAKGVFLWKAILFLLLSFLWATWPLSLPA